VHADTAALDRLKLLMCLSPIPYCLFFSDAPWSCDKDWITRTNP